MDNQAHKKLIVKSEKGNDYFISPSIPQVLILHPILKYLLKLSEKGINLERWLNNLNENKVEVETGIEATKKELNYYYKYMLFLDKNNFFKDVKKRGLTEKKYNAEFVRFQMANTEQIVFEVTERCNLKCRYCGYGELYSGFDGRDRKNLSIDRAKSLLAYMKELYESPLHRRTHKKTTLSFYGGEPLLNMPFIEEIISDLKGNDFIKKKFHFAMTTNGVELDKYMDFLAENDFHLLISLDGNEEHNGYRLFQGGRPSFDVVFDNIRKLRKKYPIYFDKSVNLISVLHNKNTHRDVKTFFEKHFQKSPIVASLKSIGIKPEKKEVFREMYGRKYSGMEASDFIKDTKDKDKILQTPFVEQLTDIFHQYSGFLFKKYDHLLYNPEVVRSVSTGTCAPFEKRVYLTTNGEILPCERISHEFSLGNIDEDGVHIDFQKVADKYNGYYSKLMNMCNRCFASDSCRMCIFYLDISKDNPQCENFMTANEFKSALRESLSLVEETPQFYPRIMRDYQVN